MPANDDRPRRHSARSHVRKWNDGLYGRALGAAMDHDRQVACSARLGAAAAPNRDIPWYKSRNEKSGPSEGFVYSRKQNRRGEEVGGICPYISAGSLANNEPVIERVLVTKPDTED